AARLGMTDGRRLHVPAGVPIGLRVREVALEPRLLALELLDLRLDFRDLASELARPARELVARLGGAAPLVAPALCRALDRSRGAFARRRCARGVLRRRRLASALPEVVVPVAGVFDDPSAFDADDPLRERADEVDVVADE